MKYKYIAGLLVALSFNSGFAAEVVISADSYQEIYSAFHRGGVANINAALKNNEGFNHNNDVDTIRRSAAGFALRKAVISLNAADLQTVVEANHEFFKTSLGISLVYGWTLNQFKDAITPYYIGRYFSFGKMFQGLADNVAGDVNVRTFLKSAFTRGLRAVEDDRWAFYDHMLYLPYAIEKVRETAHVAEAAPSMEMVIPNARRSRAEAQTEAAILAPEKAGRAAHLMGVVEDTTATDSTQYTNLSMVKRFMPQRSVLFASKEVFTPEQETFLSLIADTGGSCCFLGNFVFYTWTDCSQNKAEKVRENIPRQPASSTLTYLTKDRSREKTILKIFIGADLKSWGRRCVRQISDKVRSRRKPVNGSCRIDETYMMIIKISRYLELHPIC